MNGIPDLKLLNLWKQAVLTSFFLLECGCGLQEKIDRRNAFAVLGMEDHGEQLLRFEQFRVTVRSSKGGNKIEISAPGFDVLGCGFGSGPNPYSSQIDQVVGIANGGNKTLRFSMDSPTHELFYGEWDKVAETSRYQLIWSSKGAKESNKTVDATAGIPVFKSESPAPTHHL